MKFPIIPTKKMIERLEYPKGKISVVIDTDTYNELDDQFAITYALHSPDKYDIKALYAAPFDNHLCSGPKDGMEKSYNEIIKILKILKNEEVPVYKGATSFLKDALSPIKSEASLNLIERAHQHDGENPLYVIAIGAITNVASAILLDPSIIDKIVVVWLGGHTIHWNHTKEFNLYQDIHSSRTILDCGVPLILAPCMGMASHLIVTLPELKSNIADSGEIGAYLYETFKRYEKLELENIDIKNKGTHSRPIWDLAPFAYLTNEEWAPSSLISSPMISDDFRWSFSSDRHFIRYIYQVDRDSIIGDMYKKINEANKN